MVESNKVLNYVTLSCSIAILIFGIISTILAVNYSAMMKSSRDWTLPLVIYTLQHGIAF